MELNHSLDAVAALGMTPCVIGQPASVKVLIDGHVIAKALGRGEQGVQFDLLDGFLFSLAALGSTDRFKNFVVRVRCQFFRNLRETLEHGKRFDGVHQPAASPRALVQQSQPRFPCPATTAR